MAMVLDTPARADLSLPLRRLWADAPVLTFVGLIHLALAVPTLAALVLETRTLDGVNVWQKPLKFDLAIAIYTLTLAFYARFLPPALHLRRWFRVYMWVIAVAFTYETLWIGGAALYGVASHFNASSPVMQALYGVAGLFATIFTAASLVFAVAVGRNRGTGLAPPVHLGLWIGLALTLPLTLVTAGYMSSTAGHLVGNATGGPGLWLFGWSREVGDLRVAHLFSTHAMQALPLLGWAVAGHRRGRSIVAGGAVLWAALVLGTFAQALAGRPFLLWLG